MADPSARDLIDTFAHLGDDGAVTPLPVTETFWQDLAQRSDLTAGRLVSFYEFDSDWESWEVHPAGDEIVCLVSGAADLLLELPDGVATVELRTPGSYAIVPRGTWHTAHAKEPTRALFITAGAGTDHKPA